MYCCDHFIIENKFHQLIRTRHLEVYQEGSRIYLDEYKDQEQIRREYFDERVLTNQNNVYLKMAK